MAINPPPKCLFFDVFGTCVDWRKTVTDTLWSAARVALNSPTSSLASRIRMTATDLAISSFVLGVTKLTLILKEWRNGYLKFVREIAMDGSKQWKTVDEHHLESLREILTSHGLIFPREDQTTPDMLVHDGSLWDEPQLQELNLVWHRLDPWSDTCRGIQELNKQFYTCTLSNGNLSLLKDMVEHAKMDFTHVYSAEMFQSYKPSPKVYLGAAEKMGLKPEECAMVAAHLGDLKAAKSNGFSTIYVERPLEERDKALQGEDIVDIWIKEDEEGFVTAAERLGIQVQR
ncbi:hypothetical protein LTR37_001047 [Vermiconidia calcicola]|uniref:Uncharacterized protein n=1 Tax=Vermiconidia calcicola TaxID=1690605 RepID=A0ACC3NXZ4_9PEZI|nr:hypothetical protein LTR37_001047 [Vermiconidia calcicola]